MVDKLKALATNGAGTKLLLAFITGGVGLVAWQNDKLRDRDVERDRLQDVQIQNNRIENGQLRVDVNRIERKVEVGNARNGAKLDVLLWARGIDPKQLEQEEPQKVAKDAKESP